MNRSDAGWSPDQSWGYLVGLATAPVFFVASWFMSNSSAFGLAMSIAAVVTALRIRWALNGCPQFWWSAATATATFALANSLLLPRVLLHPDQTDWVIIQHVIIAAMECLLLAAGLRAICRRVR